MAELINVRTRQGSSLYPISIDGGSLRSIGEVAAGIVPGGKVAIISNRKVNGLYGLIVTNALKKSGLKPVTHLIGDGERFKSLRTLESTLKFLGENKISRTDLIVAVGGGVVGDLAGFAAAVYLRGIKFIQVPTTLLSMIDSSVGGKTGVNTSFGKNLVGAFYQPSAVVIDPDVLATLPKRELTAGFCEAVKQGALSGTKLLDLTQKALDEKLAFGQFDRFLAEQIRFKASIVAADERESAEKTDAKSRKILNFGHTFGHAIEAGLGYGEWLHGEAVGAGMVMAAELSVRLGLMPPAYAQRLTGIVQRAGLPVRGPRLGAARYLELMRHDKKAEAGEIRFVVIDAPGRAAVRAAPDALVAEVLEACCG